MFFKGKRAAALDDALQGLIGSTLFTISLNENRNFTNNDGSAEAMRDYLIRNAQETASDAPRQTFFFEHEGARIYPIFTSLQKVQDWIKKNPFGRNEFTAFTVFQFQAPALLRKFAGAPPSVTVILNPMSEDERVLSRDELQTLARLSEKP